MNVQSVGYQTGINYAANMEKKSASGGLGEDIQNKSESVDVAEGAKFHKKTLEERSVELDDAYAVMTSGVNASKAVSKNESIQIWLKQLGFYNGEINGELYTDKSRKAIKNFQRVYNLPQSGQMENSAVNKLKEVMTCYRTTASRSDLGKITQLVNGHTGYSETQVRDNFAKIWAFLKVGMGLTDAQASGVAGNIMFESGCYPTNAQDKCGYPGINNPEYKYKTNDRVGYGIMQWTLQSRKQGLQNKASEMGLGVNDLNAQLAFIRTESTTTCKSAWANLRKCTTAAQAAAVVFNEIEISQDHTLNKRTEYAQKIYSVLH